MGCRAQRHTGADAGGHTSSRQRAEQAMQELKDDYTTRLGRLDRDNRQLHIDTERLNNEKIERLEKLFEKQGKTHANALKELQPKNVELEKTSNKSVNVSVPGSNLVSNPVLNQRRWLYSLIFASLYADRESYQPYVLVYFWLNRHGSNSILEDA